MIKNKVLTAITLVSLISCSTTQTIKKQDRSVASIWDLFKKDKDSFSEISNEETERFQELIERNLVWRAKAVSFYKKIATIEKSKRPIPSSALTEMLAGFSEYEIIHEQMNEIINDIKWITEPKYEIVLDTRRPTGEAEEAWHEYNRARVFGEIKSDADFIQPYIVNPNDKEGRNLITRFKRSFAAGLVLFDNYEIAVNLYANNNKLRRLLNYDSQDSVNFILKLSASYTSLSNRKAVAKSVEFMKAIEKFDDENNVKKDYFHSVIDSSHFYSLFNNSIKVIGEVEKFSFYKDVIRDQLDRASKVSTYGLSKFFGNGMGLFASRKGKMLTLSSQQLKSIEDKLKPLDVLLEKTPFRLTDKFIPGHYGHVAIWSGSEKDLKELGLWNHEMIKPHQQDIKNGKRVIEALRDGVQINTLHHFMNIDDFAVLRHKDLDREQIINYTVNGFKQIGKTYDFNFDVETDKRIVCSELAYVVYDDMQWPTEKALGRITISPDNVAIKATNNGPFRVISLFYDGREIKRDLEKNFTHLLNLEYDDVDK